MNVLKVSAKSLPNSVAGAIAGVIRENNEVEIQAVGAGATNQAIKSIACLLYTSRLIFRLNEDGSVNKMRKTAVVRSAQSILK